MTSEAKSRSRGSLALIFELKNWSATEDPSKARFRIRLGDVGGHDGGRSIVSDVVWWLAPGMVLMFLCAASSIPFGAWTLYQSRLPSWMKGLLKWPLGDNLSPAVATLQGWANLFIGTASLVLLLLLAALPALLRGETAATRVTAGAVLLFVTLLLIPGVVLYFRSVVVSHQTTNPIEDVQHRQPL